MAALAGIKHLVLLGYSLPLDDAIWGSSLTAMPRRKSGDEVYCSTICGYQGLDRWLYGAELEEYLDAHKNDSEGYGVRAINNAKKSIRFRTYSSIYAWNPAGFSQR